MPSSELSVDALSTTTTSERAKAVCRAADTDRRHSCRYGPVFQLTITMSRRGRACSPGAGAGAVLVSARRVISIRSDTAQDLPEAQASWLPRRVGLSCLVVVGLPKPAREAAEPKSNSSSVLRAGKRCRDDPALAAVRLERGDLGGQHPFGEALIGPLLLSRPVP